MNKTSSEMKLFGITTNNIKGIDITIDKGINLIIGPSGSGKTSLAYDTIAQIGLYEYLIMFNDNTVDPSFSVQRYENMMTTVPIKQSNHNNNIRSTIGTYFRLNEKIAALFASFLNVSIKRFTLNNEENTCEQCHGTTI